MSFLIKYRAAFVIAFFFLIRLYGIQHPPLEVNHNWRQVTGLMVARNYHEGQTDFSHPMIDDIGVGESASSGIVGMEFPILNYLFALIADIFGYDHWYGRLISLLIGSIGLWWFYLLVKRWRDENEAFIALLFLATSVWFAFSRKFMPDVASISLSLGALYYALKYFDHKKFYFLLFYLFLSTLAILVKISASVILSVMIVFLFLNISSIRERVLVFVFSIFPIVAAALWYFVWNVKISRESGVWYNSGESLSDGLSVVLANPAKVANLFYFNVTMSYIATFLAVCGMVFIFKRKDKIAIFATSVVLLMFGIYAVKSGRHFVFQHYYMIPLSPLFAALGAHFLMSISNRKLIWVFALGVVVEGLANQIHDFRIHQHNLYKMKLEHLAADYVPKGELIVINGEGNPQELYLSHRKGWVCESARLHDAAYLKGVFSSGARYVVVNQHRFNEDLPFELIYSDEDYFIYKMNFSY